MVEPATQTDLAFQRTRLAYDRTMLAWVRTAASLITFGFSIYKFFHVLQRGERDAGQWLVGPFELGLVMICLGLCGLFIGTWDARKGLRALRARQPGQPRSMTVALAILIAFLGILLLAVMIAEH